MINKSAFLFVNFLSALLRSKRSFHRKAQPKTTAADYSLPMNLLVAGTSRCGVRFPLAALLLAFPAGSRADYTATVSPNTVMVNNWTGWGVSLCWWANVVGSYANRTQFADLAFTQLKFNIARYNVGGGENPSLNVLTSYRAKMQGFEPTNGVWNWNADLNQRWMLQAALSRGVNLVDAFANSPPWWMTVSGSVTGAVGGTNNLQTSYETNFVNYMATVVSNLVVLDGVHFNYVTPINEPSGSWAYAKQQQEGCHVSTDQQARVISDLRTALNNSSLQSAYVDAPEDVDPYQSVTDLNSYNATTLNSIGLCTTHTYGVNGSTSLASKALSIGKPLWVSEYGDGDGTGLTMAQRIHDDITVMKLQAWCYWQLVDSAGGWGLLYNPLTTNSSGGFTTSYTINEKFYVMGQFSEYIRPGCNIISVNDTNTLAAYTASNSTLVLVAVNTNTNSYNVTYDLSAFGVTPWQVALVTQTASGENMASKTPLPVVSNHLTSSIPAKSVTTFILATNAVAPTVLSQGPATNGLALYPGQTPTFSVSVVGTGPLYYQWKFNGVVVAVTTNASFTPTAAQFGNVTNIVCMVTNSAGSVSSRAWSPSIIPAPTAAYPRAALALNPVDYWRLNESPDNGSGNNGVICHDYVGGCNGVYSNVILSQTGYSQLIEPRENSTQFGSFLATNSAALQINCQDFSAPAGSNGEFSASAWINGAGFTQSSTSGIVTRGYFYGEELTLDEGAPNSCLRFSVRNAAGAAFSANSAINAGTNGGWHHLVGVCDQANGNVLIYVDGALAGSAAIPANSGITNASNVPLAIGARAASAATGYTKQFLGWINDVALYNYALSSNQVQTLYQAGVSFPPVGLTLTNLDGNHLQCNWNYGVLQSATNIAGPYQDMANVTQPYVVTLTNTPQMFYRVRQN
jgi:O-glycosyl hydrolase